MITDTTTEKGSDDLAAAVRRLHSELENVQRELDQALEVWRHTLIDEKKELESQVHVKEKEWAEREKVWTEQRKTYEQKLESIETSFKTQLENGEQNALRALNDLDDSWQRDKLSWAHGIDQQSKELQIKINQLTGERDALAATTEALRFQMAATEQALQEKSSTLNATFEERARERAGYTDLIQGLEDALDRVEQSSARTHGALETLVQDKIAERSDSWESERAALLQAKSDAEALVERSVQEKVDAWQEERASLIRAKEEAVAATQIQLEDQRALWETEKQAALENIQALEKAVQESQSKETEERAKLDAEFRARHEEDEVQWKHERTTLFDQVQHLEAKILDTERSHAKEKEAYQRDTNQLHQFELERGETERQRLQRQVAALEQSLAHEQNLHQQQRRETEERLQGTLRQQLDERQAAATAERQNFERKIDELQRAVQELEQAKTHAVQIAEQDVKKVWEQERATWQQGLLRTLQEANDRESVWAAEKQRQETITHALEKEVAQLRQKWAAHEQQNVSSKAFLEHILGILENEIFLLNEMVTLSQSAKNGRPDGELDLVPLASSHRAFR
jgi:hypothetical protein